MILKPPTLAMLRKRRTGFQPVQSMAIVTAVLFSTVVAEELSIPVKVFPAKVVNSDPTMQVMENAPPIQPTLPGGKLPQYQLGHHQRVIPTASELKSPRQRLLLALPTELVLIEATIIIDGNPFRMVRENRIQQSIKEAALPTPVVEKVTNAEAAVETKGTSVESAADPVPQPTVPPYAMAATVSDRLRRYIEATGEAASADEVRWLMTNWIDGPVLLFLNDNFQRFRANQRPVFHILDRDRDGTISADEIALAVASFQECDLNRNEVIDYIEIAKVADDPRSKKSQHAGPGKIIFQIPDAKSAALTYERIAACYLSAEETRTTAMQRFDLNSDGRFNDDELTALHDAEPDLTFTVSFNSAEPKKSRLSVTTENELFSPNLTNGTAIGTELQLPLGGTSVTFSAIQADASDQISIGAVNDGYPILPVIDPNEDGRFTIRELRSLVDSLQGFDLNGDGSISANETQATIRICFGLGPIVHRELSGLRQVNPKPKTPPEPGPDWFVRMDRNKDNDLTRGEFPGTDEQFRSLDTDQDDLVSAAEAKKTQQ